MPKPQRLVISHDSALLLAHALRGSTSGELFDVTRSCPLPSVAPRTPAGNFATTKIARMLGLPAPLSVAVRADAEHTHTPSTGRRIWRGALPETELMPIMQDVCVCSPELALCQIATRTSVIDLALLVCELCGTYALDEPLRFDRSYRFETTYALDTYTYGSYGSDGFAEGVVPLTSLARIGETLTTCWLPAESCGPRRLREALDLAVEGAASPTEAYVSLMLCAPRLLGGYGIPRPKLNVTIPVEHEAQPITSKQTIRTDLLWAHERLVVMYLDAPHTQRWYLEQNTELNGALAAMGYRIIKLSHEQMGDFDAFDTVAAEIACRLGVHRTRPSKSMLGRRKALHERLFGIGASEYDMYPF